MPHVNWHQKLAPKNNPANSPLALSVIFGGLNPKIGAKFSNDLRSEPLLAANNPVFLSKIPPTTAFATENPSRRSIIGRTSPFQGYRIHLGTFLQYFPNL